MKLTIRMHSVPTTFTTMISRLLTFSSEYFSSFVHTTCTLSVSRMYLALGVVYLPLALKFQTTRLSKIIFCPDSKYKRGFHSLWHFFPKKLIKPSLNFKTIS